MCMTLWTKAALAFFLRSTFVENDVGYLVQNRRAHTHTRLSGLRYVAKRMGQDRALNLSIQSRRGTLVRELNHGDFADYESPPRYGVQHSFSHLYPLDKRLSGFETLTERVLTGPMVGHGIEQARLFGSYLNES